jgi:hypothetical protein
MPSEAMSGEASARRKASYLCGRESNIFVVTAAISARWHKGYSMNVLGEPLFGQSEPDLNDVLCQARELALTRVDKLPLETFAITDDMIADELARASAIHPILLLLDNAGPNIDEPPVTANDGFRDGYCGSMRLMGIQVTKSIPFEGDPRLLHLRPTSYDLNPPLGKIQGNVLIIGKGFRESEGEDAKRYIKNTETSIDKYLAFQRSQIEAHNSTLAAAIKPRVAERRARLAKAAAIQKELDELPTSGGLNDTAALPPAPAAARDAVG